LFASSWYIFLTYIYDARSHLHQINTCYKDVIQVTEFRRGQRHHQAQKGRKVITKHSLVLNLIREM